MVLQTLHEPVVIVCVCLWDVASLMGLYIIYTLYTGIGYKLYYMPLQEWSPQQHYVQVVVLASLGIFFSTSKCRPRPAKGSLPVVCVQETKTLHAQHKQSILRFTCVFHKTLTVNIYSKHSRQLCSWHDNPIQSQLETLIRPMDGLEMLWLELLVVNYLQVNDLMLVHYTWCYKHYMNQ